MRKAYIFIFLLLLIGIKNVSAIEFDTSIKVYDYAQVLSSKQENQIKEQIENYINNNKVDMAVITVKYFEQKSVEDYLDTFYNTNGFGIGNNKSAMMMVINLKDNLEQIYIKAYGDAEKLYNDDEINNIINAASTTDNYNNKIDIFIDYSNKYTQQSYNISNNQNILSKINWFLIIVVSLLISTVLNIFIIMMHKNKIKKDNVICYVKKDSVVINTNGKKFITTNTKKKGLNDKRSV